MIIKIEINEDVLINEVLYILRRLGREIQVSDFANKSIRVFNSAGDPVGFAIFEMPSQIPGFLAALQDG